MTFGVRSPPQHFMLSKLDKKLRKYRGISTRVKDMVSGKYEISAAQAARLERMRVLGSQKLQRILGFAHGGAPLGINTSQLSYILEADRPRAGEMILGSPRPIRIERKE